MVYRLYCLSAVSARKTKIRTWYRMSEFNVWRANDTFIIIHPSTDTGIACALLSEKGRMQMLCKDKRISPTSLSPFPSLFPFPHLSLSLVSAWSPISYLDSSPDKQACSLTVRAFRQASTTRAWVFAYPGNPRSGFRLDSSSRLRFDWSPAVVYYATTAKCWQAILASTSLIRNYC